MKAKLDRVALIVKDVDKAVEEFGAMFGVEFYGPFDDDIVGVRVALPKCGGMEMMSPIREDDGVGATQKLATKGEGITGIAMRTDNIDEAIKHFEALGMKPDLQFSHGGMKEILFYASEKTHGLEVAINEYPEQNGCGLEVAADMGYKIF